MEKRFVRKRCTCPCHISTRVKHSSTCCEDGFIVFDTELFKRFETVGKTIVGVAMVAGEPKDLVFIDDQVMLGGVVKVVWFEEDGTRASRYVNPNHILTKEDQDGD